MYLFPLNTYLYSSVLIDGTFMGHLGQNSTVPPVSHGLIKKVREVITYCFYWSWREELNPRPADYKSAALPTELRQQLGLEFSVIN